MTEFEFLSKYGHLKCVFLWLYRNQLTYYNKEKGLWVMGFLTNHSELGSIVTINKFWQNTENFNFRII